MKGRILIVDDEKNILLVVRAILEGANFEVQTTESSRQALEWIQGGEEFDVLVTDLNMPEMDGMALLEQVKSFDSNLPVVMITAFGTVDVAVGALRKGAFDFITKPFEKSDLLETIEKAVRTAAGNAKEPINMGALSSMVGASEPIMEVFRVIQKIADSPSTVLIHGESGTGKELVAKEIHERSSRAKKPFIKINCAAIPSNLIESELFGHERGAFTGAVAGKPGRFELADGGTLFLDEIADMPLEMQVKLLRVIQEQEFERVGGVSSIQVDVRLIAASNRDLPGEVKSGRFREDLFYRLNVVPMHLPPLRERNEDIELLIRHFIQQFNKRLGKNVQGIRKEALEVLRGFEWPGNIRQLENVIERMLLMSEGELLTLSEIPSEVLPAAPVSSDLVSDLVSKTTTEVSEDSETSESFRDQVKRKTQSLERELIMKALQDNKGNITRTAEKLELSRKGLQLKMKELGLSRKWD